MLAAMDSEEEEDEKGSLTIMLQSTLESEPSQLIVVDPWENVLEAVLEARIEAKLPTREMKVEFVQMGEFYGTVGPGETFESLGAGERDVLLVDADVWRPSFEEICDDLESSNPHLPFDAFLAKAVHEGGELLSWDLQGLGLTALPESFCTLHCKGNLDLSRNDLTRLPTGAICNPDSRHCNVDSRHCNVDSRHCNADSRHCNADSRHCNADSRLPTGFGQLRIGGDLGLSGNILTTLPESFGSLEVGGDLELCDNRLLALPDDFGSLIVRGDIGRHFNAILTPL